MEKSELKKTKQRRNDLLLMAIIIVLAALVFAGYFFWYRQNGSYVVVTVDGKEYVKLSLNEEKTIDIKSENGINKLQIKEGFADMIDADCPDGLCVDQRKISKKGETIICLPHKIVVEVISEDEGGFDGIAG